MSSIITCPKCASALRVPPGTEKVRCPKCRTILTAAGQPVPAEAPRPDRPFLPFDHPTIPDEDAKPRDYDPPTVRTARRGQVVYDDDPIPPPSPSPFRRKPDSDEKLARKLEAADALAKPARIGVQLMSWGANCTCAAAVLYFLAVFSTIFTPLLAGPVLILAAVALALHWLFTAVGFSFCCGGPVPMRGMAASGVAVLVVHGLVYLPLVLVLSGLIDLGVVGFSKTGVRSGLNETLLLSNLFNNLSTVTDLPVYLLGDGGVRPVVVLLPVFGGALEFAKLSLVGILANYYAVEGKAPELGYQALRFVYRIFWLVIAWALLKLFLWVLVTLFAGDPLLMLWFAIPVSLLTLGYFLWWAFAWFAVSQVLHATVEVIDPRRFADTRARLEY